MNEEVTNIVIKNVYSIFFMYYMIKQFNFGPVGIIIIDSINTAVLRITTRPLYPLSDEAFKYIMCINIMSLIIMSIILFQQIQHVGKVFTIIVIYAYTTDILYRILKYIT